MSFVNPYNFVRPGKAAKKESLVWHHKFGGRSGKIVCTLKTLTPIFIPDSEVEEKEVGEGKYHKIMKFYRVNGVLRLPPTSLKGMVRSVAETASNSCFSQFEGGKLGKRLPPSPMHYRGFPYAGIIIELPTEDKNGKILKMKPVKITEEVARERGIWDNVSINGRKIFVKESAVTCSKVETIDELSDLEQEGYRTGYLKTSFKFGTKRFERVFVEEDYQKYSDLPYSIYQDFRAANKNSDFDQMRDITHGDTVWFREQNGCVGELGFAQIYRKWFKYSVHDKLECISGDFLPCPEIQNLCPACRIFGTVTKELQEERGFKAFAGNMSFSGGKLLPYQNICTCSQVLRILLSPKLTFHPFYLYDEDYNSPESQLRGRKFYWHQPYDKSLIKYFLTKEEIDDLKQRKQFHLPRTVELLLPSVEFEFSVEFENLKPEEIGILLWSRELEEGMAHKLGMGKPLGLGSVELKIKEFQIINRRKRYQEIFSDGVADGNKAEYISTFKGWLKQWNDNKPFDEIRNIKDLKSIMSLKNPPDDAVQYPPDGFQWFMHHRNEPLLNISDVERGKKQTR